MTDLQKRQITNMRVNGSVFADIASELNLSINSVKSFCRRNNVTPSIRSVEATPEKKADREIAVSPEIVCKRCGQTLSNTPGHRQKIFCSAACQQKYWWEHRDRIKHKSLVSITCPVCGHIFSDYAGHRRKYCSHACYIAHRYGGAAHESE